MKCHTLTMKLQETTDCHSQQPNDRKNLLTSATQATHFPDTSLLKHGQVQF